MEEEITLDINTKDRPFDAALYGETIRKGFAALYQDDLVSDITLILGGEKVPAHRMVLCAWSETFKSMLSGGSWQESTLSELPISLDDDSDIVHFKNMLKYMYTGDATFIDNENIVPIIRLSDYYGILSLKELCGELMGEQVSEGNILFCLEIVDHFDCLRLNSYCGQYLAEHFQELLEETPQRLYSLKISTWAEMLKDSNLSIGDEESVFKAVKDYADQFIDQPEVRDEALTTLLPLIRYSNLSLSFITNIVETDFSIQHLPIVNQMLYELYKYKVYKDKPPSFPTAPRVGFQRFDKDKTGGISVSRDGKTAISGKTSAWMGGWKNIKLLCPISSKFNYIEFILNYGTNVMIGVVDGDCSRQGYVGQYANGYALYNAGGLYANSQNTNPGITYNAGDRVGIQHDAEKDQLVFYVNGKNVCETSVPKNCELYPTVSFSAAGTSVTILPNKEPVEDSHVTARTMDMDKDLDYMSDDSEIGLFDDVGY